MHSTTQTTPIDNGHVNNEEGDDTTTSKQYPDISCSYQPKSELTVFDEQINEFTYNLDQMMINIILKNEIVNKFSLNNKSSHDVTFYFHNFFCRQ